MLEKTIVNKVIKYLKSLPGCFCWKQHGGQFGTMGLPDIICCISGRFVAFEVKRPAFGGYAAGKLTPLQLATITKIQAAGGIAVVVTSLEDVKYAVENLDRLEDILLERR